MRTNSLTFLSRGVLGRSPAPPTTTTTLPLLVTASPLTNNLITLSLCQPQPNPNNKTFRCYPCYYNNNNYYYYYYYCCDRRKKHSTTAPSIVMSQLDKSVSAGTSTASFEKGGDNAAFPMSESSVLKINKGDITQWSVNGSSDAIVNPANERMLGGGGADGAIHRAAGPELRDACYKVPEVRRGVRCPTGEARITLGFKLPASHVIHTVGPIYDADSNPAASLSNAYRNSLIVAKNNNIKYIAFPAISCGVYRYPLEEAATVAISTVKEFANDFKEVHFVMFSDEVYNVWLKKAKELLQA